MFLRYLAVAICAFALSIPCQVGADEKPACPEHELGQIEVFGTGEEVPYSKTVINEGQIKRQNSLDAGDLLKAVPNMAARRTGLFGLDPVLRGLVGDQLNVLIDGTKVWGACPGRMDPPSAHIMPDELEAVEVIRGPFSVRYGANTLGGVINFISKQPQPYQQPEVHGQLDLGYDEAANGRRGQVSIFGGDRPYDYRISAGGRDYGDYESPRGEVENSSFRDGDYRAALGFNLPQNQRLDLSISQGTERDVHFPARSVDIKRSDDTLSQLQYTWREISPLLAQLTAKAYYNAVKHVMNNEDRDSSMFMEGVTHSITRGAGMESQWKLGKDSVLAVGADYYGLSRNGDSTSEMTMDMGMMGTKTVTTESKSWDDARQQDVGLFGEWKAEISPQWHFQLGLRTDLVEADSDSPAPDFLTLNKRNGLEQHETNFSGNVGLAYDVTQHVSLRAAVGRGVRSADTNERYIYFFPNPRFNDNYQYLGNPGLNPEQSLEEDAGFDLKYEHFTLGVTLFHNYVHDYIIGQADPQLMPTSMNYAGIKRYTNIDARLVGGELNGMLQLTREVSLKGDTAYTEGRDVSHNRYLAQVAPWQGHLALHYDSGWYGFWSEVGGRFAARQNKIDRKSGDSETGGFSVFDIALGITPIGRLTLTAGVQNVFDKAYAEHLNGIDQSTGEKLLEPGRNAYARISWAF